MDNNSRLVESMKRFKKLVEMIKNRFELVIEFDSTEHASFVHEHYSSKCHNQLFESGGMAAFTNDAYAKSFLICEAARIWLVEIAPKRMKKRKRKINRKAS